MLITGFNLASISAIQVWHTTNSVSWWCGNIIQQRGSLLHTDSPHLSHWACISRSEQSSQRFSHFNVRRYTDISSILTLYRKNLNQFYYMTTRVGWPLNVTNPGVSVGITFFIRVTSNSRSLTDLHWLLLDLITQHARLITVRGIRFPLGFRMMAWALGKKRICAHPSSGEAARTSSSFSFLLMRLKKDQVNSFIWTAKLRPLNSSLLYLIQD